LPALSPQKQREHTLRFLLRVLIAEAAVRPLVVLFEDLHWIDPSTLEFIESLMEEGAAARILTLLTARPSFKARWGFRPYLTQLDLVRLHDDEVEKIIAAQCGGKPLP